MTDSSSIMRRSSLSAQVVAAGWLPESPRCKRQAADGDFWQTIFKADHLACSVTRRPPFRLPGGCDSSAAEQGRRRDQWNRRDRGTTSAHTRFFAGFD